jgi:large subunit ribosomal protein LP2
MKYIAAYALLVLGGKANPKAADVDKVLKEAGIKSDAEQVEKLISALAGKTFHELVQNGNKKMASMGTVDAAPTSVATSAPVATQKEPVKEVPKEEEIEIGMDNLFPDEY